jgi:hypothetical protein
MGDIAQPAASEELGSHVPSAAMRVGVVEWTPHDEIISLVGDEIRRLGHSVIPLVHDRGLPGSLDAILACGPFGSLMPLAAQLRSQPAAQRPALVLWMTEQLSNPALPTWLVRVAAELRSGLERRAVLAAGERAAAVAKPWRALIRRGLRLRYYGDLLWLRRHGLLSVLAIPSAWLAELLRGRGFAVTQATMGSDPRWGADLGLERDIPVLWIGSTTAPRRRRNLAKVCADLRRRGIEVAVVDGVAQPAVFGEQRVRLLNRTQIVLNLLRAPWDSNALRFYLAAPNRALVITEPTLPHHPLGNGTHLVEAPIDHMADVVCRYLADGEARQRIVDQAYRLVTTQLTMAHGVARVMHAAAQSRAAVVRQ